jgi:hypothetical protein
MNRKYMPNIVKGASDSVNASLSLKAFNDHFRLLLSHPTAHSEDMSQYLPDQLLVSPTSIPSTRVPTKFPTSKPTIAPTKPTVAPSSKQQLGKTVY